MSIWVLLKAALEEITKFIARIQGFWCEKCGMYEVEATLIDVMHIPLPGGVSVTKVFNIKCPTCGRTHKAFISEHNVTNMI